jgi:hypothetical protein
MTPEPESHKASRPPREMLTVSQLPLFATDRELGEALLGKRAKEWPRIARHYEGRGLPPVDPLFGGRHVPSIMRFFDALNGACGAAPFPAKDGPEYPWQNNRKRRA